MRNPESGPRPPELGEEPPQTECLGELCGNFRASTDNGASPEEVRDLCEKLGGPGSQCVAPVLTGTLGRIEFYLKPGAEGADQ